MRRIVTHVDTLADDLVLLSLNPASGRVMTAQKIAYGLMGSELVRLVGAERVEIPGGRLSVRSTAPTGDAELDAALASIAQASRPPRAQRWVSHPRRGIATAYLERLAVNGIVRKERGLITRWRVTDMTRLAEARARIEAIAMSAGPVDLDEAALAGLAHAIGLDAALYPGSGSRGLRRRFKDIAEGTSGTTSDTGLAEGIDAAADGPAADHAAAHHGAVHHASQAAISAATEAAIHAATEAAVHAAVHAAVDASVSAAHSAGAGGHGGH